MISKACSSWWKTGVRAWEDSFKNPNKMKMLPEIFSTSYCAPLTSSIQQTCFTETSSQPIFLSAMGWSFLSAILAWREMPLIEREEQMKILLAKDYRHLGDDSLTISSREATVLLRLFCLSPITINLLTYGASAASSQKCCLWLRFRKTTKCAWITPTFLKESRVIHSHP